MLRDQESNEIKLKRGLAQITIGEEGKKLKEAGATDDQVFSFIRGARKELARQAPDVARHGDAIAASQEYKRLVGSHNPTKHVA